MNVMTEPTRQFAACLHGVLQAFDDEGVKYCSWKSNQHLAYGAAGHTDLDLLVARPHAARLGSILAERGFKRFVDVGLRNYPAVESYFLYDPAVGRLIHLHVHYLLVTGEKYSKNVVLPWHCEILNNCVRDGETGICVARPEHELILLLIRIGLKTTSRQVASQRLFGTSALPPNIRAELEWLCERVDQSEFAAAANELLGASWVGSQIEWANGTREGRASLNLAALRLSARRGVALFRRFGAISGVARYWAGWVWVLLGRTLRGSNRQIPLRRRNATGGRLVAVVGPDGAGKSTVVQHAGTILRPKFDVSIEYLGSGKGSASLLRGSLMPLVRVYLRLRGRSSSPENGVRTQIRRRPPAPVLAIWAVIIAIEKRRKMHRVWRARARGALVLTDRFPQAEVPFMNDGPRLSHLLNSGGLLGALARWEENLYKRIAVCRPDLVIRLSLPDSVAAERGDMAESDVHEKAAVIRRLRYAGADIVDVDAGRPLESVVDEVLTRTWEIM